METLIKIVKVVAPEAGYEMHYRVQGQEIVKIEFVARPCEKGKVS